MYSKYICIETTLRKRTVVWAGKGRNNACKCSKELTNGISQQMGSFYEKKL